MCGKERHQCEDVRHLERLERRWEHEASAGTFEGSCWGNSLAKVEEVCFRGWYAGRCSCLMQGDPSTPDCWFQPFQAFQGPRSRVLSLQFFDYYSSSVRIWSVHKLRNFCFHSARSHLASKRVLVQKNHSGLDESFSCPPRQLDWAPFCESNWPSRVQNHKNAFFKGVLQVFNGVLQVATFQDLLLWQPFLVAAWLGLLKVQGPQEAQHMQPPWCHV